MELANTYGGNFIFTEKAMSPASAVRWITAEAVTDHAGSHHHGNT